MSDQYGEAEDRFKSERFKVAFKEYEFVELGIDRFDERSLKIKTWSITLSGVALGAGFNYDKPTLFLVAAFSSAIFWYLEASWKYFQDALILRAKELEDFLNGRKDCYTGPGVAEAFQKHFNWKVELKRFPKIFLIRNVNLPHSVIVLAGLALYYRSTLENFFFSYADL